MPISVYSEDQVFAIAVAFLAAKPKLKGAPLTEMSFLGGQARSLAQVISAVLQSVQDADYDSLPQVIYQSGVATTPTSSAALDNWAVALGLSSNLGAGVYGRNGKSAAIAPGSNAHRHGHGGDHRPDRDHADRCRDGPSHAQAARRVHHAGRRLASRRARRGHDRQRGQPAGGHRAAVGVATSGARLDDHADRGRRWTAAARWGGQRERCLSCPTHPGSTSESAQGRQPLRIGAPGSRQRPIQTACRSASPADTCSRYETRPAR